MSSPRRVVSLLPAATEMVYALGAGARLVGRSHACDFPTEVTRLPSVTRSRINPAGEAAEVHQTVSRAPKSGESLFQFQIDRDQLRALEPELILTQGQCAVCAVSLADLEDVLRGTEPQPEILSLAPQRFADLWQDLRQVGRALGLPDEGRAVIAALKARVVDVIQRTAEGKLVPTVACLEWLDPLMGAGNWIPELVELAGGQPVLARAGIHSVRITFDALASADPEIIVAMPCGLDLTRTQRDLELLATRPEWGRLRAVREGRLFATDGNAYFNRPGPRLVDSLEILAEIVRVDSNRSGSPAEPPPGSTRPPSAPPGSGPQRFHRVPPPKSSAGG